MDDTHNSKVPNRSLTEPSTPLKNVTQLDEIFVNYSQPTKSNYQKNGIHLPPHELASVTARLSQQNTSAPGSQGRPGSRPRSRAGASYVGSRLNRLSLTPTRHSESRRISEFYEMRDSRRRRSSMILTQNGESVYDPNYVGPITVDYLRFFCRVSVQEKERIEQQADKEEVVAGRSVKDNEDAIKDQETPNIELLTNGGGIDWPNIRRFGTIIQSLPIKRKSSSPPQSSINEFDQSLPLPNSDRFLRSPVPLQENEPQPAVYNLNPFLEDSPPPTVEEATKTIDYNIEEELQKDIGISNLPNQQTDNKPFSYLERILQARKSQSRQLKGFENIQESKPMNSSAANDSRDDIDIRLTSEPESRLIIEDKSEHIGLEIDLDTSNIIDNDKTISIRNEVMIDDIQDSGYLKIDTTVNRSPHVRENKIVYDNIDFNNNMELDDYNVNNSEAQNNDLDNNYLEDNDFGENVTTPPSQREVFDADHETNDSGSHNGIKYSPSKIVTPQNGLNSYLEQKNFELQRGLSPDVIIQEEYTIENDNQLLDLLEDPIAESNDYNELLENNDDKIGPKINEEIRRTSRQLSSKAHKMTYSTTVPITMIKKLVKSVQLTTLPNEEVIGATTKISKKSKRIRNYSPEVYKLIQEKSDEFIQNMVSDLEAYASHRTNGKGNSINIKDVLLYLNRIKFAGQDSNRENEIENISKLAQNFMPLELLISLNNSLNTVGGIRSTYVSERYEVSDGSDDDSVSLDLEEHAINNIRGLKTFSESDSE